MQNRTDRIVFKLFGKDPSDFPLVLRKQVCSLLLRLKHLPVVQLLFEVLIFPILFQILDWLSNSPTDVESYIRPGCIILTIYIRMDKSSWDKVILIKHIKNLKHIIQMQYLCYKFMIQFGYEKLMYILVSLDKLGDTGLNSSNC